MQLQSSCRDILMRVSDILMRVSECYTFELAIITRSMYNRAALFTNGIISFTSVLQYPSKTVTMVPQILDSSQFDELLRKHLTDTTEDRLNQEVFGSACSKILKRPAMITKRRRAVAAGQLI